MKNGSRYEFRQSLEAPYYQPFGEKVTTANWTESRTRRRQSEVCRLEQSADVTEVKNGFRVRIHASGTNGVPLAIELGFREGGQLDRCRPIPDASGTFLLEQGFGRYGFGGHEIRFGPGSAPHRYVQLRGAEARLPGMSVYITGSRRSSG